MVGLRDDRFEQRDVGGGVTRVQCNDDVGAAEFDRFHRRRLELQTRITELRRNRIAHADEFGVAIDAEHVRFESQFVGAVIVQSKRQVAFAASHVDHAHARLFAQVGFAHQVVENLDDALQLPVLVGFCTPDLALRADDAQFAQIRRLCGIEHIPADAVVLRRRHR